MPANPLSPKRIIAAALNMQACKQGRVPTNPMNPKKMLATVGAADAAPGHVVALLESDNRLPNTIFQALLDTYFPTEDQHRRLVEGDDVHPHVAILIVKKFPTLVYNVLRNRLVFNAIVRINESYKLHVHVHATRAYLHEAEATPYFYAPYFPMMLRTGFVRIETGVQIKSRWDTLPPATKEAIITKVTGEWDKTRPKYQNDGRRNLALLKNLHDAGATFDCGQVTRILKNYMFMVRRPEWKDNVEWFFNFVRRNEAAWTVRLSLEGVKAKDLPNMRWVDHAISMWVGHGMRTESQTIIDYIKDRPGLCSQIIDYGARSRSWNTPTIMAALEVDGMCADFRLLLHAVKTQKIQLIKKVADKCTPEDRKYVLKGMLKFHPDHADAASLPRPALINRHKFERIREILCVDVTDEDDVMT